MECGLNFIMSAKKQMGVINNGKSGLNCLMPEKTQMGVINDKVVLIQWAELFNVRFSFV